MTVFKTKLRTDPALTQDKVKAMFLTYADAKEQDISPLIHQFTDVKTGNTAEWFYYPEKNIFACKRVFRQDKILYTESYIFNEAKHTITASVEENVLGLQMPVKSKFPGLFKSLMDEHLIIVDEGMPYFCKNGVLFEYTAKDIAPYLTGKKIPSLPVIYINDHGRDVKKFVGTFLFTAYIISQGPLEDSATDLLGDYAVPKDQIGIFIPSLPNIILVNPSDYVDEDACIETIKKLIDTLWILKKSNVFGSYNSTLIEKLKENNAALRNHIEDKNTQDLYQIIHDLEKDVSNKTATIHSLQAKVNGLETQTSMSGDRMLYSGDEKEWYAGEAADYVLSILTEALQNIPEDSRKATILKDILNHNPYQKIHEKRKEQVRTILSGYRNLNDEMEHNLNSLGYTITTNGAHYKVTPYNDARYMTIMSKTASDHRAGLEIAGEINSHSN